MYLNVSSQVILRLKKKKLCTLVNVFIGQLSTKYFDVKKCQLKKKKNPLNSQNQILRLHFIRVNIVTFFNTHTNR